MLEQISARHYAEWRAYFAEQHLDEDPHARHDLNAAMIQATLVALNQKRGSPRPKISDFFPEWRSSERVDVYTALGQVARPSRKRAPGEPQRATKRRTRERKPPTE